MTPPDHSEVLDLAADYVAETGLDIHVCAAFIEADLEPPTREAALRGYSAQQAGIISNYMAKHDPYGAREGFAKTAPDAE
jgi:hypothetical protein